MNNKYIKRDIFNDLKSHLSRKEITMIIGPRQCGKTTIMNSLINEVKKDKEKVLFLNLDFERDKQYFKSQEKLINKIKLEFGNNLGFIFIDEVQRLDSAGVFLKGIYDMNLGYKFIVSGSGNVEIKEKISESLMGRKRLFRMKTITFNEFVNFKTNYKYKNRLSQFFEVEVEKRNNLLMEYMNFGGYPRVIVSNLLQEKQIEIDEIYQSYINQDIIRWLKVEKIGAFEKLIKLSASQIGNLVNYNMLASDTGLSVETMRNYLWYLQRTFILKKSSPFFKNKKKEIVKSPLFYFYDIGLRNYIINQFGVIEDFSSDIGFIFENFIFNSLNEKIQHSNLEVNFWRTKSQAEVDFVINLSDQIIPIEAKFKNFKKAKIGKSMRSFIKKYKPQKAFAVNRNFSKKVIIENTELIFLPFWRIDDVF